MSAFLVVLAVVALVTGASIGYLAGAWAARGAQDDLCRACRLATLSAAFRDVDSFGGTDD